MKKIAILALFTAISSTAFAKTPVQPAETLTTDFNVEVAYTCKMDIDGKQRDQLVTVMYGIKNNEPIVAQAKINQTISVGLFRVADPLLNRFVSESAEETMWTAMPAKAADLRKVHGGKLSVKNGHKHDIIADDCKLNKSATAKLK